MSAMDRLDQIESRAKGQPWVSELYADNAALVAALRAVLDIHRPDPSWDEPDLCGHDVYLYPCPTVRAIEEALS